MNRAEADREAWEDGTHPCQVNGHCEPWDPQDTECVRCGADLSVPEDER